MSAINVLALHQPIGTAVLLHFRVRWEEEIVTTMNNVWETQFVVLTIVLETFRQMVIVQTGQVVPTVVQVISGKNYVSSFMN